MLNNWHKKNISFETAFIRELVGVAYLRFEMFVCEMLGWKINTVDLHNPNFVRL